MLEFLFKNAYIIILVIIGLTSFLGKMKQPTNTEQGERRTPPKPTGTQMPSFGEADPSRQPQVFRSPPSRPPNKKVADQAGSHIKRTPVVPRTADGTSIYAEELAGDLPTNISSNNPVESVESTLSTDEYIDVEQARKGMMWAEIFGPPKAKQWHNHAKSPYKRN